MASSLPERLAVRRLCFEEYEMRRVLSAQAVVAAAQDDFALTQLQLRSELHDDYELTGSGQTVVVIDTGIAYDHRALGGGLGPSYQVVGGWDFTAENDADPYDDGPAGFHGTHVAGIIASQDQRYPGLAPDVDLVALRVFDDFGGSQFVWIENALRWVHEHRTDFQHPITTVNLSIGMLPTSTLNASQRILDDELAQLASDGIFVSVAAGNGYDIHPTPGLSYPAASPWVVPVGSVDPQGQLSDFSRRDERVLLAPGEEINSTITDFLFDFNRVTDDWYRFSGTSQAAPYVAGAAVIVREALQRAGRAAVDQRGIVEILRNTSDDVFDSVTNRTYSRINLRAAVRSILGDPTTPVDGGHSNGAPVPDQDLGQVVHAKLSRVGLADGQRVFRFTPTHDGWLLVSARFGTFHTVGLELLDLDGTVLAKGPQQHGAVQVQRRVNAGEPLLLRLQGEPAIGELEIANLLQASGADTGQIDVPASIHQVEIVLGAAVQIQLDTLSYSIESSEVHALRLVTSADQQVVVRNQGLAVSAYIRAGRADITEGSIVVQIEGARQVTFASRVGAGDQVRLYGGSGADRYSSRDGSGRLVGDDYQFQVVEADRVYVFGGGGDDLAQLFGSNDSDNFVSHDNLARLSNSRKLNYVEDFERVYGYAGSGGVDRAMLFGSEESDSFVSRPDAARLVAGDQLRYVESFDRVFATGGSGGLDRAYLYGSSGYDEFRGSPTEATLSRERSLATANEFERVYAYAEGGEDLATLVGSPLDDRLLLQVTEATLGATDYHLGAYGFARVVADGGWSGTDTATLRSASEFDRLQLGRKSVTLTGVPYSAEVRGFAKVQVDDPPSSRDWIWVVEQSWTQDSDRWRRLLATYQLVLGGTLSVPGTP